MAAALPMALGGVAGLVGSLLGKKKAAATAAPAATPQKGPIVTVLGSGNVSAPAANARRYATGALPSTVLTDRLGG